MKVYGWLTMIPSAGFDAASSTISLRSRMTSATARMIASRRAVRRYGFGMAGLASVFPPPKFIPDPVVPVSCLAPLLAGALLLLPSLIRLLCVSTPLPCPNAEAAPIETRSAAKKTVRYFIREFLKANRETGGRQVENRAPDNQIQARGGYVVSDHERLPGQVKRSTKTLEAELVVCSCYLV